MAHNTLDHCCQSRHASCLEIWPVWFGTGSWQREWKLLIYPMKELWVALASWLLFSCVWIPHKTHSNNQHTCFQKVVNKDSLNYCQLFNELSAMKCMMYTLKKCLPSWLFESMLVLNLLTDLPPTPLAGSEVLVLFLLSEGSDKASDPTPVLPPCTPVWRMTSLQKR